jgi:putative membrane-bound dehydrogenase-like protein
MKPLSMLLLPLLLCCSATAALAGDPPATLPWRYSRPPNDPRPPREAVKRMTVPPSFHVDLIAAEPDIVNPIAMAFDDRGRLYVTESVEYPRKSPGPGRDRIKIVEGFEHPDGARVTTFAEGLNIPTGIAIGYGGVWVLNAPDLLFYRQRDDGTADGPPQVILTGFGRTDTHELPSSLTWGPDGWLYGLNGVFNESHVIDKNGKRHDFTCALWRLHPRTREFQVFAQGTSNPYGIAWDSEGSAIIEACHWATDHLFHFVETGYYTRQAGAYPPFTMRIGSITDHGHYKTAYCGIACLDTDAFPPAYRGLICVGNVHAGSINADRLQRDGSTYLARCEPDLLVANDDWSMPVCLKIGPDGCLYVLDWYDRYHCSQDAARDPDGVDRARGRIYRLRYGDSPRAATFNLGAESDAQLLTRLAGPNGYFRETAQRLLTERLSSDGDHAALRESLERLVFADAPRAARMHALWSLIGGSGGGLDPAFHERLLAHDDPGFRAWGVRAAGNAGHVAPAVAERITRLAGDASADVQLQIAIASRKIEGCDALAVLVQTLAHCGQDKLIPAIAWPNLHPLLESSAARYVTLIKAADFSPAISMLMPRAIDRILGARQPDADAASDLLEYALDRSPERAPECIAAIAARAQSLGEPVLSRLSQRLEPIVDRIFKDPHSSPTITLSAQLLATRLHLRAAVAAGDTQQVRTKFLSPTEPPATRLQALDALIAFHDPALIDSLPKVLSDSQPPFAARVLAALGRVEDPKLADVILAQYPKLPIETQPLAIDLLMQREPWARKLLDAVLAGKLPKAVLNANHLRKIMETDDREAIWAVEKAYGSVRSERDPQREKVVAEMTDFLRHNIGDPAAGQRVFAGFCAQCHTIYGQGAARVGPDLTANGRANFEQLVSNVFDPSLVIGPAYQVTTVVTRDGRNLTGLIAEDNEQRIVLRLPGEGEEAIPRGNVKYTRISKLSMMPEGIEDLLSRKDLADLFAFLSLDKPPDDPTAKPIPGAPPIRSDSRIKIERDKDKLQVRARLSGEAEKWIDLATYVLDPTLRPYLHPLRDPSGQVVLTDDRPADHPWQHGVFTGFHKVNGFNYWKEDEGRQRFVKLLDVKEQADRVSWRALVELVAPDGSVVLEEEDAITFHAPRSPESYVIDFDLLLRAKDKDVTFGKYFVGGLSVRMPWDKANPRIQTHVNSQGQRDRECEQQRAQWCNVERPFALANGEKQTFGIAIFDHPANIPHPPGWRVDEQGLINPNVSSIADWTLAARKERLFRYRILVYKGTMSREKLAGQFETFAGRR